MKCFTLSRSFDFSGVSGTGHVLEGAVFTDGTTVIRWTVDGKPNSTAVYNSYSDFKLIHIDSHPDNGTVVEWLNKENV